MNPLPTPSALPAAPGPAAPADGADRGTAAPLLEVERLCAGYGRARILFEVSLSVGTGEVVALMGRNGAGKSTTLKAIMGLVERSAGQVRFDGSALGDAPPHATCRRGIGYVPEDRRIFTELTVRENLAVARRPPRPGIPAWTEERVFALFPALVPLANRRGGRMSGGEQQMLTVARTLMGNPRLVLLDEPSEGVAPIVVEHMARTIVQLKREGLAVLLSEQNLPFARAVADRAVVLKRGEVRFTGTLAQLDASAELQRETLSV